MNNRRFATHVSFYAKNLGPETNYATLPPQPHVQNLKIHPQKIARQNTRNVEGWRPVFRTGYHRYGFYYLIAGIGLMALSKVRSGLNGSLLTFGSVASNSQTQRHLAGRLFQWKCQMKGEASG